MANPLRAACTAALILLGAPVLAAQGDALERFKDLLRAASEKGDSSKTADLRAARELLDEAEGCIDGISDPRWRAQAQLFVGVRRADLLFRAGNLARAAEEVQAARAAAMGAGVWQGPYQETGLLLLWQSVPLREFEALVGGADAGADAALVEGRTPASAENELPLRLLHADLLLWRGDEAAALRVWTEVAEALRSGAAPQLGPVWTDKCHGALVWYLLERREYARAAAYVPLLHDVELRSHYAAILSNQRGDFQATELLLRHATDPRSLLLLADALEQLGDLEGATAKYWRVIDRADDAELVAAACNGLGDCRRRHGDGAGAQELYARSLTRLEGLTSRKAWAEVAENHKDLGLLAEAAGDLRGAHAHHRRALATLEQARAGLALDPFGQTFLEPSFLAAVDGALRTAAAAGADAWDLLALLEWVKARSLLDRAATPPGGEPSAALVAAVRRLARATGAEEVDAARLEVERLRAAHAGPAQSDARPLDPTGLQELAKVVPATLCSYWLGEDRAWLVWARGGRARVEDLGAAADLRARLRDAHLAVATPAPEPWAALDAAAVFLPPALHTELAAGARVVFCPDDETGRLPFEALRVDGEPLGVHCAIERAPSLSVWARLLARPAGVGIRPAAVVVDSVAPPAAQADGFDPLRFSGREGDLVAAVWPEVRRLQGGAATLAALEAAVWTTPLGVLHLSAHARLHPTVPSASLLMLADGGVPMPALSALRLAGATVVLSACTSAVGEGRGGEGDASLLWGPIGAGAKAVVASLWPVNQQATCDLMGQFHYWLARGASEADALRRARAALLAAPNYAHPHYWAGFAAFGAREAGSGVGRAAWAATFVLAAAAGGAALWWLLGRRRA